MQKSAEYVCQTATKIVRFYCPSRTRSILDEKIAQLPRMPSCDWQTVCLHDKPVISDPRSWYMQLHAEIGWPVNFKNKCMTSLSSNQRRTHTVRFLCCFAVTIASNIEACAYLSSLFFLSSLSWRQKWRVSWFNNFIGRFFQETKPGPQKLANIIDRLTPA